MSTNNACLLLLKFWLQQSKMSFMKNSFSKPSRFTFIKTKWSPFPEIGAIFMGAQSDCRIKLESVFTDNVVLTVKVLAGIQ